MATKKERKRKREGHSEVSQSSTTHKYSPNYQKKKKKSFTLLWDGSFFPETTQHLEEIMIIGINHRFRTKQRIRISSRYFFTHGKRLKVERQRKCKILRESTTPVRKRAQYRSFNRISLFRGVKKKRRHWLETNNEWRPPCLTPFRNISLWKEKKKWTEKKEENEESSAPHVSFFFFFTPFARLSIFDSFFRCAKALSKRNCSKGKTRKGNYDVKKKTRNLKIHRNVRKKTFFDFGCS